MMTMPAAVAPAPVTLLPGEPTHDVSVPLQSPLQSIKPFTTRPVTPPEHTRQSSTTAAPKQVPAQSRVLLFPPHTPHASHTEEGDVSQPHMPTGVYVNMVR